MRSDINLYASTVTQALNHLLVKGKEPQTAWIVGTRIDMNYYNDDEGDVEEGVEGGFLSIACYAPKNYVHVLATFSERPLWVQGLAEVDWQPIACHDSCWRDGVESTVLDAYRAIAASAVRRFKCEEKDLFTHVSLHMLQEVTDPKVLLAKGLDKPDLHGKLVMPGRGA